MTDGNKHVPVKINMAGYRELDIPVKTTLKASGVFDIPLKTTFSTTGDKDVPVKTTVYVERTDYGLYGESVYDSAPRETIFYAQGGTPDKSIAVTDPYWFIKSGATETGKEGFMEIGFGQNNAHNETDANLTGFVRVQLDSTSGEGEVKIKPSLWFYPGSEPTTPQEGMMYYDDTANDYMFYNGATWQLVGGGASGGVGGSGTQYTLPRFTTSTTLGDSQISEDSGGTLITVGVDVNFDGDLIDFTTATTGGLIRYGTYGSIGSGYSNADTVVGHNVEVHQTVGQDPIVMQTHGTLGARALRMQQTEGFEFLVESGSVTAGNAVSTKIAQISDVGYLGLGGTGATPGMALDIIGTSGYQESSIRQRRYVDSAYGPGFYVEKARGTGLGSETIVNNGDQLWGVATYGWDGDSFAAAASLLFEVDGAPSGTAMPGRIRLATSPSDAQVVENVLVLGSDKLAEFYGDIAGYGGDLTLSSSTEQCSIIITNAYNDGNPYLQMGSHATNDRFFIQTSYNSGTQEVDNVTFQSVSTGASANDGRMLFYPDSTLALAIDKAELISYQDHRGYDGQTTWKFNTTEGTLDFTPSFTGSDNVIDITPSITLTQGSGWQGIFMDLQSIAPETGTPCNVVGMRINATNMTSVDNDAVFYGSLFYTPRAEKGFAHYVYVSEQTTASNYINAYSSYNAEVLSQTATYRGTYHNWSSATRDGGAPILEGIRVDLPASYADFGVSFAAQFTGDDRTVRICDTNYGIYCEGMLRMPKRGSLVSEVISFIEDGDEVWFYLYNNTIRFYNKTDVRHIGHIDADTSLLNLTGTGAGLDLNPSGTTGQRVIDIRPSAALDDPGSSVYWRAMYVLPASLDPTATTTAYIYGLQFNASTYASADNLGYAAAVLNQPPVSDTSYGLLHQPSVLTANKTQAMAYSSSSIALGTTGTYRGVLVDWSGMTAAAGTPNLRPFEVLMPASYTNMSAYAGNFTGDGRTVQICNDDYALEVDGDSHLTGDIYSDQTGFALVQNVGTANAYIRFLIDSDTQGLAEEFRVHDDGVSLYGGSIYGNTDSSSTVLKVHGSTGSSTGAYLDLYGKSYTARTGQANIVIRAGATSATWKVIDYDGVSTWTDLWTVESDGDGILLGDLQVKGDDVKDSAGNTVISFDGAGEIDQIGSHTGLTSGEYLKWDGSKWTYDTPAGSGGPGSGTQWTIPVWDTTTTLGDSMVTQDSGGTVLSVGGQFTVASGTVNVAGTFTSTDNRCTVSLTDDDTTGYVGVEGTTLSLGGSTTLLSSPNMRINTSTGDTTISGDLTVTGGDIDYPVTSGRVNVGNGDATTAYLIDFDAVSTAGARVRLFRSTSTTASATTGLQICDATDADVTAHWFGVDGVVTHSGDVTIGTSSAERTLTVRGGHNNDSLPATIRVIEDNSGDEYGGYIRYLSSSNDFFIGTFATTTDTNAIRIDRGSATVTCLGALVAGGGGFDVDSSGNITDCGTISGQVGAISLCGGNFDVDASGNVTDGQWTASSISTTYTAAKCTATWPNTYSANQNLNTTNAVGFSTVYLTGAGSASGTDGRMTIGEYADGVQFWEPTAGSQGGEAFRIFTQALPSGWIIENSGGSPIYCGEDFHPKASDTFDLGSTSYQWEYVYADYIRYDIDSQSFDHVDDLAIIDEMGPNGEVDPKTGIPMMDHSSLPDGVRDEDGFIDAQNYSNFLAGGIKQLHNKVKEQQQLIEYLLDELEELKKGRKSAAE